MMINASSVEKKILRNNGTAVYQTKNGDVYLDSDPESLCANWIGRFPLMESDEAILRYVSLVEKGVFPKFYIFGEKGE
jgi:hypothetical protein